MQSLGKIVQRALAVGAKCGVCFLPSRCQKICKIAVEILQSINNRMQNLREILRMVIIDIVINID